MLSELVDAQTRQTDLFGLSSISNRRSYDHFWCMTGEGSGVTCW